MTVNLTDSEARDVQNLLSGKTPSGESFDASMDKFLLEFFPGQYKRARSANGQAPVDPATASAPYEILSEGEGWIEIVACEQQVRLERRVAGSGRPRVNPYIDTRIVNSMRKPLRDACYAAAEYMLRKDGKTDTENAEKYARDELRKRMFGGRIGTLLGDHLSFITRNVYEEVEKLPGIKSQPTDVIITRALMEVLIRYLDSNYKGHRRV